MKAFLAVLLVSIFWAPCFSSAKISSKGEIEINQFFLDLTQSLNQKNPDLIAALFKVDGELITLAGGIYKGRNEIKSLFGESFAGPFKDVSYEHFVQFIRFTDTHHVIVDGVWKIANPDSSKNSCGLFVFNLSKVNGSWKIDLSYSSEPRQGHTAEHGRTVSWTEICKK